MCHKFFRTAVYKSGDDKTKLVATAEQIRTELQAQIPTKASLFKTVH